MNDADGHKVMVVVITATSHSGHTWLNLMLGAHSEIVALGELNQVNNFSSLQGLCSLCGSGCDFWDVFNREWNPKENLFVQLAAFTGKRIFVITQWGNFLNHLEDNRIHLKGIRLIRDGRAVAASLQRKYSETSFEKSVKRWVKASLKFDEWLKNLPAADGYSLLYEDLVKNPSDKLKSICNLLNVNYEEDMFRYWEKPQHILGGNRGTLFFMRKHLGIEIPSEQQPVDPVFYEKQKPSNFLDERWRNELTSTQLAAFEHIAGSLNREYGYPVSEISHKRLYSLLHRINSSLKKLMGKI